MDFRQACLNVIAYCPDGYAKSYADGGLKLEMLFPPDELDEAIRVQCLYILNNVSTWRGDVARETKLTLRALSKRKRGK